MRHLVGLGVAVLAVSSAAILAKECRSPAPATAFYRMGITFLFLLPAAWFRGRKDFAALDRRSVLLAFVAGALLGAHYITWFSSLELTSVASSVLLVSLHPLFVALLSSRIARDRVRLSSMLAVLLSLGGAVLLSLGDLKISADHWKGDLLALVGGFLAALYFLSGRVLRRGMALVPYMVLVYGCAAACTLVACLAMEVPLRGFDGRTYLLFLLLALVPTLVGHTLIGWVLRYLPAHVVSLSQLGEPVGATLLAFFLLGEKPGKGFVGAACLVLAGIGVLLALEGQRIRAPRASVEADVVSGLDSGSEESP